MKKLFIIAGEASGDLHGGQVALALKKINPDIQLMGTGGSILESAGAELFYRVEDLAVIGFSEVLKVYRFIKRVFDEMVAKLDQEKPDAVLLVDYPAFNLRFAAEAKKRGIKVIYYIAPQVWAWKKNRIKTIREVVDELIVLFPFEVPFFEKENVTARCFGHPLLDIVKPSLSKAELRSKYDIKPDETLISLLPGSRKNEMGKHLPLLLETVRLMRNQKTGLRFIYPLAPTVSKEWVQTTYGPDINSITLAENDTYNVVAHSDFTLVASGTATLETAILETPNVIFYKTSLATYLIGKYILNIQAIGLPNIIKGEIVVPENPRFVSPKKMADEVLEYLTQPSEYERLKSNLAKIRNDLGETGAYVKTADYINEIL